MFKRTSNPHLSTSELGIPTFLLEAPTSEPETPTSELEASTFLLQRRSSEPETSSKLLQHSSSELRLSPQRSNGQAFCYTAALLHRFLLLFASVSQLPLMTPDEIGADYPPLTLIDIRAAIAHAAALAREEECLPLMKERLMLEG